MCNVRKAMAALLVLVLSLSIAFSASAATSPTEAPVWDRHIYTATDNTDTYFPENGAVFGYSIATDGATLLNVNASTANTSATADEALDGDKKVVSITQIGSGTYGIGEMTNGSNVKTLTVNSDKKVTIAAKAFRKTNVSNLIMNGTEVAIKANAFNGSSAKTVTIAVPNVETCDNLQLNKKAFNGLKKVTIKVSKSKMSTAEFKKLKAKMKKKYGKKFGKSILLKRV